MIFWTKCNGWLKIFNRIKLNRADQRSAIPSAGVRFDNPRDLNISDRVRLAGSRFSARGEKRSAGCLNNSNIVHLDIISLSILYIISDEFLRIGWDIGRNFFTGLPMHV